MLYINYRFLTQKLTGVQRFGFEISKQLVSTRNDSVGLVNTNQIKNNYVLLENYPLVNIGTSNGHIWEQYDLRIFLKRKNNPLLLGLGNTGPLFYKNQIITIHDLAFLYGNWHSYTFRTSYKTIIPLLARNSLHIVTVSEFSKSEITKHYHIPEDKVTVIYNAPFTVTDSITQIEPALPENYILSVGSIDPRKNLKRLIKAFVKLNIPELNLLLIGASNKNFANDKELSKLLKENHNIHFLGYKTDAELKFYYEHALFFVYPALYEGFGLPPVEAMSFGCPVIVSDKASLPEVCGAGAIYCNPESVDDIYEKMSFLLSNPEVRASMINSGKLQASKFSWEQSVNKLNSLINKFV